jgi:hypothetical protein
MRVKSILWSDAWAPAFGRLADEAQPLMSGFGQDPNVPCRRKAGATNNRRRDFRR